MSDNEVNVISIATWETFIAYSKWSTVNDTSKYPYLIAAMKIEANGIRIKYETKQSWQKTIPADIIIPYSDIKSIRRIDSFTSRDKLTSIYFLYYTSSAGRSAIRAFSPVTSHSKEFFECLNKHLPTFIEGDLTVPRTHSTKELSMENEFTGNLRKANKSIYAVLFVIVALLVYLVATGKLNFIGNHNATATCKVCERTWSAGDSGGNYKSIARTGMCVNCYENYNYAQKTLGN